jgi:hypothetical protein
VQRAPVDSPCLNARPYVIAVECVCGRYDRMEVEIRLAEFLDVLFFLINKSVI